MLEESHRNDVTPRLLTNREAAKYLRVCERTLFKLRQTGELRAVLIRGAVRFAQEDLEAFIEARKA